MNRSHAKSRTAKPPGRRRLRIGLVYDLRREYLEAGYPEEQVAEFDSDATLVVLEDTLRSLGLRPARIGNARALCRRLADGERWDLVFNIAEGLAGRSREAQAPAILELYEIPYTFSDPLTCAVTLDKAAAKALVREAGLRTPDYRVVRRPRDAARVDLPFPLFAKPLAEGTGKGIGVSSLIRSADALRRRCAALLRRYRQPVLVEEFLPGREFTTGIVGTAGRAAVLGSMEVLIVPQGRQAIYSFEVKEKSETMVRYTPLREPRMRRAVESLALDCYRTLECRDAARVDIRLDGAGRPAFLEVNPLAGLHPTHSDLPMIATQEGWSYRDLIGAIVESAMARAEGHVAGGRKKRSTSNA